MDQGLGESDDLRAEDYGEDGEDPESQYASQAYGQEELQHLHLKYSGGKNEQLEGCRWRKHGGNHQGQEFLLFKAIADAFQPGFTDALQQKELASGASQQVREETAYGRANGGRQAVEERFAGARIDEAGYQGIHGNAKGRGIQHGDQQHTPRAQRLQGSYDDAVLQ